MRKAALISVISFFVTLLFITVGSRPINAQVPVTYYGCYLTKDGSGFRIVTGPGQCKKNETEISWNSVGPQGPKGDTGATGPEGPQGVPGDSVVAGQQCASGAVTGFDEQGNVICGQPTYAIGDTGPAGGKVFYVTDGGLHGLEAAPEDQASGVPWGCYGTEIAGADGHAVGTGAQNTAEILAGCSEPNIAARIAHDYILNGYNDWFLPSRLELNLLYEQKDFVGGFVNCYYWSSTEYDNLHAWWKLIVNGNGWATLKNNVELSGDPLAVRAVRAF